MSAIDSTLSGWMSNCEPTVAHLTLAATETFNKRNANQSVDQSIEEAEHASKIMAFLLDNEVEFDLPGLSSATTHYKTPKDAVGVALASEIKVTGQFNKELEFGKGARADGQQ